MPKKRLNTQEFISRAIDVHGNKYDYSKVEYIQSKSKVKIICPEHGAFEQTPIEHMRGKGCKYCSGNIKLTTNKFVDAAQSIHKNKYDYSKTTYKNNKTKILIICPEHGEFKQRPDSHLSGKGCIKCSGKCQLTTEEFIDKAIEKHGDTYDYSKVNYEKTDKKVEIICPQHGVFMQKPNHHLLGSGCPKCNLSKGELLISKILDRHNINYESQKTFPGCKDKRLLHFDFYLPDKNICIEYDGEQHFKAFDYFGGAIKLEKTKNRDKIKTEYCYKNNIRLLRIRYDDDAEPIVIKELNL